MEDNASYYMWSNPGWAISNPEWAINTPSTDILFDYAITYMKGSCVLHMLRYTLGDSLFFMGINQYATNPALRYHSARISDFKNTMEQASEQDLSWFFDEWIFEPNHPDYANIYNFVSLRNGQWRVNFNVNQNNSLSGTYFQMPLEVLIHFNQGQDTLIRVMNTINHEHFDWVFDRQPVSLVFDPNGDILLKEGTTTVGINESAVTGNDLSLICKPNPALEQTSINYYLPENATVSMKLFSITGTEQKIILNNVFETTGNHTLQCDVSALPSGLYFIRLETSKNTLTHKLVVVK
jgi:aminopeptidase N